MGKKRSWKMRTSQHNEEAIFSWEFPVKMADGMISPCFGRVIRVIRVIYGSSEGY